MDTWLGFFEGFWTWNTPVSFLAGVGAYDLYCKILPPQKEREDAKD